ncbi:MAG: APC family permease [Alphaproteobacteria bacterium]|nr:APC family permease [Alphaproteobacteria bacterium]
MSKHPPPTLDRSMKMMGVLLITLSLITPASSVFIIAPGVVQQAGTGAIISFAAAALLGFATALVYAELSSAYPLTGGEYAIVGHVLGPFWGFVTLGVNLITLVFMYAGISLGLSVYLQPIFPGASPVTVAIANIVLTTLLGILNIRTNALITGAFLVIEMLALATLSYLGFSHAVRPIGEFFASPMHLGTSGALEPAGIGLIALATSVAMWAYNGYGNAVYLGEETHDAPKQIAHSILWALAITIIAEAVPVTAVLMGAPDLKATLASPNMLSDFITGVGGRTLNDLVSLGIALAILNANIAMVVMVARQFFSTGRDKVWTPSINRAMMRIHPKYKSPWVSTLLCGALAIAACALKASVLFVIIGSSLVFIYGILCVAVIAGRRNKTTRHAAYRMPLYPLAPVAALLAMGYIIYADWLDADTGRPSLYVTVGMCVLSAGYYFFVLRRRGNWKLHDPHNKLSDISNL